MKVLFLTDSLSDIDGIGRYAVRLITALAEERPGLEVHVLLGRKHRPTSPEVPAHWKVEVALPPDYFFYMTRSRFAVWRAIGTWRARRAARRADLVHAIKDYPHSLIAVDAARAAGVPCVATAHGTYTVQPVVWERHRRRAIGALRRFAATVFVSNYTRGRLMKALKGEAVPEERFHVVPNAVNAEHFEAPRTGVTDEPWHGFPFTLGIGEVKERKGHHLALEAWARIAATERPDLHHVIVGNKIGDAYERSLREIAGRHGVLDRVHFLGNVTEDQKVDLLQRAELFIHTPVTAADGGFEGFGLVYLEAAAAGTTSVGTLDSGAEDAIIDGRTGRLAAQDPDAIEGALREILLDPARAEELEAGALAHARASSWAKNARDVLAVYDQCLGRTP